MAISSSSSSSSSDNKVQNCSKQCLESFKTLQKNFDSEREKHNKTKLEIQGYELALESLESRILGHEKNEMAWGEKYEFQNYDLKCREIKINNLKTELEKVIKERDELKVKIEKWEESSKSLNKLLNSQMNANDKNGLGCGTQMDEMSNKFKTDSENSFSIFDGRSSDEDSISANDRSSKVEGYKAIPPPITGNFLTPRADISFAGLDEYAIRNKIIESQTTELNTKTSETVGKTNDANTEKPKSVSLLVLAMALLSTCCAFSPKIAQTGSAIRPIYPRMDNVRPRASYSPIKRSYYSKPFVRPKDLKQDVKTSGVKNMTTVGTRAVVNTSKGKMDNAPKKSRWGNPEIYLQDHAVVDSGCSSHMTSNKAYLSDYKDYNGGFVAFRSDPKGGHRIYFPNFTLVATANTPYASAASTPIDANIGGSSFVYLGGQIPIDSSTLPNADLPIDPNMPDLEDDSNVFPNDGIFSEAYNDEDVGAEADFNNMDNIIDVSPIPTLRVHKDYPEGQILGDPKSAVQTRGKIQKASSVQQALTISQALEDESWVEAMQEELLQFQLQKVWILIDLLSGKKAIGTKWVFRNKRDERSIVVKKKARLVAQGFKTRGRMTMMKFYAPVCRIEAIRRGTIDKTLFIKKNKSDIMLVQVYVDDIIFGSTKQFMCTEFEDCMHKRFQMSSIGELAFFLGLQVKQQPDGIFICQDKYIADILKKFDFWSIRTATTPIESNKPVVKDEDGVYVDVHVYRSVIGSLMYLTASRLDIMFIVCGYARFQVTPKVSHLHAVKKIFSDYGGASLENPGKKSQHVVVNFLEID
ncbi:putative ribonuclease H-like domain-containing protein [Tanacetum coccineum]